MSLATLQAEAERTAQNRGRDKGEGAWGTVLGPSMSVESFHYPHRGSTSQKRKPRLEGWEGEK